jgi:transglutaminase-like putative cysteine protease
MKTKKKWIIAVVLLLVAAGGITGFILFQQSLVYDVCHTEAGTSLEVADFLRREDKKASFTAESDKIDTSVPGEYHLKIKTRGFTHDCTLYIEDTTPPEVVTKDVSLNYGESCEADAFVDMITDVTKTEVQFAETPDFEQLGDQTVTILVKDAGENTTTVQAQLSIQIALESIQIEAGTAFPQAADFVDGGFEAAFETDISTIDSSRPGIYPVQIKVQDVVYDSQVEIVDTTPPELELANLSDFTKYEKTPQDFVVRVADVTQVSFAFENVPDFTTAGVQTVTVVATDEGGNQTKKQATLTLTEDTEPPVITGTEDKTIYIGGSVAYRNNVVVTDNSQKDVELNVDSSAVNVNAAGTYPVTYTAVDHSGNTSTVTTTVTVIEQTYSEEEVYALADEILAKIITDGMTPQDKTLAIYNYITSHMTYVDSSEKGNWLKAAYQGMVKRKGDCYTYACYSKALLTRAGIKNMDIERIPDGDTLHYWNLVDIEDGWGWYHFDTCPRKDHPTIYLWTDEQIKAYSDAHDNSHNYDRSLYPEIK